MPWFLSIRGEYRASYTRDATTSTVAVEVSQQVTTPPSLMPAGGFRSGGFNDSGFGGDSGETTGPGGTVGRPGLIAE